MEEDIDIPENGLVYPKIENVFSNVTNIKTEPVDFDENIYESTELFEYEPGDYYIQIPNKIILGSKPTHVLEPAIQTSTVSVSWEEQDSFQCDECVTIVSSQNELDAHKASHSFLVARPMSKSLKSTQPIASSSFVEDRPPEVHMKRQKAVKSTAKSALLNNTFPQTKQKTYGNVAPNTMTSNKVASVPDPDRLLCNHCDERFPDDLALMKHTYELLPDKKIQYDSSQQGFDSNIVTRPHRVVNVRKKPVEESVYVTKSNEDLLQCMYCTCFLKFPNGLRKHMLVCHKTTSRVAKPTKFTGKCAICSREMSNYRQYNKHVLKNHPKIFRCNAQTQVGSVSGDKLECLLCNQVFTTRYSAYKHKALKHPLHKKKITFSTIRDKADVTSLVSQKPKSVVSQSKSISLIGAPIPKQILFKCNKCQIHFVTCSSALEHSKRCALVKGDWKCNKCRRTFTHLERPIHTLQHEHSDKFKVHIVNEKIFSKVICCCPKCELHFDENTFWKHVSSGCVVVKGVDCNTCNLKIHPDSLTKHKKYHTKHGLSRADCIVIDFVDAALTNVSNTSSVNPMIKEEGKQILYFCKICKTHSYSLKYKKFHLAAGCLNKNEKKITKYCHDCGLLFTHKLFPKHVIDHRDYNLALNDYIFIKMQDGKEINPPIPDFRKCEKCKVRFISLLQKKMHVCKTQEWAKCSKCSQKFAPDAYKIHLRFHEYRAAEESAESHDPLKTMLFYSCVTCNYGFDTYDSLVEHCQNHYIDMEIIKTSTCKICKLNYRAEHKDIHSNRPNFKILKFNYDKLLDDDWLDGFDTVPTEDMEDILFKSVYGVIRNIRLEVLVDGPNERSLYKCAQCEVCYDPKTIVDHTKESCSRSIRFDCNSCKAAFPTKTSANKHNNVHVIFGDDIPFREIVFNKESDRKLNEAVRTRRKKESLKFRKCQHCELLIKKDEFQEHVHEHVKTLVGDRKFKANKGFTLFKPRDQVKKLYTVYRCVHCKSSIMQKYNIVRHNCGSAASKIKCNKCSLSVRTYFKAKHEKIHTNLPKFVTKNIRVLDFEVTSRKNVKRNKRYSFDDDASACSLFSTTVIPKTYETRRKDKSYVDNSNESEDSQNGNLRSIAVKEPNTDSDAIKDLFKFDMEVKNKLYQCTDCYMCFIERYLLITHLSKCQPLTETPLSCTECGINYHPSLTAFHKKLHELIYENRIDNYLYIINVSLVGSKPNEDDWLWKCKTCHVHFLSSKALDYHFKHNHEYVHDYVKCDICDLKFTVNSRTRHMKSQHGSNYDRSHGGFNVEIFEKINLINNTENDENIQSNTDVTVEINEDDTQIDFSTEKHNDTCISVSVNPSFYENDASNLSIATDGNESSDVLNDNNDSESSTYDLYKCDACNIHYVNKHTLVCHIRKNKKVHNTFSTKCITCDRLFGVYTLKKHQIMHHGEREGNKKIVVHVLSHAQVFGDNSTEVFDFDSVIDNINDDSSANTYQVVDELDDSLTEKSKTQDCVSDSTPTIVVQNSAKYASSIDTDDLPLIRAEAKNLQESDRKIIRLYQCKDCRICVEKSQCKLHVCCSDIQKKRCIKCSLSFRRDDFVQHLILHKKHLDLSRKNFSLIKFGRRRLKNNIFKCATCSTHFLSVSTLEWHMNTWNHQTKRAYCELCGIFFGKLSLERHVYFHHTKLNLTADQFDIITVSTDVSLSKDDQSTSMITNSSNTDEVSINSKVLKKLFKCFECDVYFLTQTSYYKHMYKHSELDPTEYIACKMCDMQFLTEDLGVHMKSHRDRSFSLDNLLIEGYQPNENESPRIESYLAADSVNSKIVSTTTPFVNEEETVSKDEEQLSTVDSTSTKLQ